MSLHWLDVAALVAYLGGMAGMGLYFARRNRDTEEYFVGGRSFPGWAIGLSLVGTSISSVTFLAYPADAFKTAWLRYLPNFMLPVGVFIAAYVFLPFFRRRRTTSAYEYLEARFGPSVRVYGAAAFIIGQLVRVSIILYLVSLLAHEMTGLDPTLCIVLGGAFVAFYTVVGGIDAVVWTDVVQTIVLVLGGLAALAVIVAKLPGGLGQIFAVAAEHGKFAFADLQDGALRPASWSLTLTEKTATLMLVLGLVTWLTEYSGNQNVVQRYCASRSAREARKGMFVCAFASLPIWAFYMFLGTALFVFFKQFPAPEAAEMLDGTRKAEQVFPFFIIKHLPPGVTGLVIAAALAAAMSSLDSSINAIATVSVVDIYRRHLAPGRADRHYLKVAWAVATAAAALMIGGGVLLAHAETKTLQDTGTILASLLGAGLLGMYLLGFLTRRGDARAVWCGIAATVAFTSWTLLPARWLPEALRVPFDLYYTSIVGNTIMFAIGYGMALIFPARGRHLRNLNVWEQDATPLDPAPRPQTAPEGALQRRGMPAIMAPAAWGRGAAETAVPSSGHNDEETGHGTDDMGRGGARRVRAGRRGHGGGAGGARGQAVLRGPGHLPGRAHPEDRRGGGRVGPGLCQERPGGPPQQGRREDLVGGPGGRPRGLGQRHRGRGDGRRARRLPAPRMPLAQP